MESDSVHLFLEPTIMVNSTITYTPSMYDQPPKSPLSGGLGKLFEGQSYWQMSTYFYNSL